MWIVMRGRYIANGLIFTLMLFATLSMATAQGGEAAKPSNSSPSKKTGPTTGKKNASPTRSNRTSPSTSNSAVELAYWESIKDSTNPEDFKAYLRKYPNGEFIDIARNRISSLEAAAREKDEKDRAEEAKRAETAFWQTIKGSNNPEDFRAYLNKYPNGEFADLAKYRITSLESSRTGDSNKSNNVNAPQPKAAPRSVKDGTKIAIVNSNAFYDRENGIARLIRIMQILGLEFKPRLDELQGLKQRRDSLAKEIDGMKDNADPKILRDKSEQLYRLDKDITRKTDDNDHDFRKRREDLTGPLLTDIKDFAKKIATQRGLELVIDTSEEEIPTNAKTTDITHDLIGEYNRAYPARQQ